MISHHYNHQCLIPYSLGRNNGVVLLHRTLCFVHYAQPEFIAAKLHNFRVNINMRLVPHSCVYTRSIHSRHTVLFTPSKYDILKFCKRKFHHIFLFLSISDPDPHVATGILRFQFWHQLSHCCTVRRCFWSILGFHYQPVSFLVLTKARRNCCKLPVTGPTEDEKKCRKLLQAYLLLI